MAKKEHIPVMSPTPDVKLKTIDDMLDRIHLLKREVKAEHNAVKRGFLQGRVSRLTYMLKRMLCGDTKPLPPGL